MKLLSVKEWIDLYGEPEHIDPNEGMRYSLDDNTLYKIAMEVEHMFGSRYCQHFGYTVMRCALKICLDRIWKSMLSLMFDMFPKVDEFYNKIFDEKPNILYAIPNYPRKEWDFQISHYIRFNGQKVTVFPDSEYFIPYGTELLRYGPMTIKDKK